MSVFQITSAILMASALAFNSGCVEQYHSSLEIHPYLSITETFYDDPMQTNMLSKCTVYDLNGKKLEEKGKVPYTSAYPLTCFSTRDDCIYYSAYSGHGDQLYRDGGETQKQLTDQLCALNHIVQCGDKLYISGKYLEHYCIEPEVFNLKTGELRKVFPDPADDRFTWTATCDPLANTVIFSYYSDNEQRARLNGEDDPPAAPSNICSIDMATEEVRQIYSTDDYIWGIAAAGQKLYYAGSRGAFSREHKCYVVDLQAKTKTELDVPVHISGEMAVWKDTLYCLGWKDGIRGIYEIDLATMDTTLIYSAGKDGFKGFINGFSLNY